MKPLDLDYPAITKSFGRHLASGRTESRAFVAWFLEHYYRLELDECHDAICDGPDDKGVDGIYIDATFETIDIFQSKLFQNPKKTLGDTLVKEFQGTLSQFKDGASIALIAKTTKNADLSALIADLHLETLLNKGYKIRGVFLTNGQQDTNAKNYLATHKNIIVWDRSRLLGAFIDTAPPAPQNAPVKLDISGFDVINYRTAKAQVIIAPIKASDLLRLNGLKNGALFAWNVRKSLGRTKVNKEIAESIANTTEHKNFLLYHNGLTILCQKISLKKEQILINGYNVVNGCQSLTTLAENESIVTDELRLITRLVELPPNSPLAAEITRRSNNQNAISARDLQSNSNLQRRLQLEIRKESSGNIFYEIKRGESDGIARTLSNDEAARILLAFDIEEPWSCHQSYKLFDELHARIFARPEVNGRRILSLESVYSSIVDRLDTINDELVARYRLTRYTILYLVKEALKLDPLGKQFCQTPESFYVEPDGAGRIASCVGSVITDIIVDLNAELKDRKSKDKPFDYKRELKSPTAVKALAGQILPLYEKALARGRVNSFEDEWNASKPKHKTKGK